MISEESLGSPIDAPSPLFTHDKISFFRTPKALRKGKKASDNRILGTPDYLAPELLLGKDHGSGVDWWALGVCLYQMSTGFLPFNGDSALEVFDNILNKRLDWPDEDEMSIFMKQTINSLLTNDPEKRSNGHDLRKMPLFEDIQWDDLLSIEPPFIPQPDSRDDTSYFRVIELEELWKNISERPLNDKYLLFEKVKALLTQEVPTLLKYSDNANDLERIKLLLTWKKEVAIVEIHSLLPFVKGKPEVVQMFMRILPMYFSHSTLHDTEVEKVLEILTFLRLSPSFVKEEGIFDQWYQTFKRRTGSKKFTYKDESCVRNLPIVTSPSSAFAHCIGYVDVHLFRNFHRWLRLLRLHKYLFLFANMSYEQVMRLDEENFEELEENLNVVQVTAGAKAKILREVDRLRQRRQHLEEILKKPLTNSTTELEEVIRDLKRILRTPIPQEDIFNDNLPQWIMQCLHKVFRVIFANPDFDQFLEAIYGLFISLLKEAWNYNIFSTEDKNSFNEWRTILSDKLLKKRNVGMGEFVNHSDSMGDRSSFFPAQRETEPSDLFSVESWKNNTSITGFENMINVFSNLSVIDAISYLNAKDPPPQSDRLPISNSVANDQYVASENVFVRGTSYPWE